MRHRGAARLLQLILEELDIVRQWLVRFAQFMIAVREGAVVAELAFTFRLEELADLRLVVAVRDVHHF